jgi:hypothetical protein
MIAIRKTAPLAVLGLGLFAALAIVALGLSATVQNASAQDPDGVIVGIDMVTTSNTCPQNVAGVGADCTLAPSELPPGERQGFMTLTYSRRPRSR